MNLGSLLIEEFLEEAKSRGIRTSVSLEYAIIILGGYPNKIVVDIIDSGTIVNVYRLYKQNNFEESPAPKLTIVIEDPRFFDKIWQYVSDHG